MNFLYLKITKTVRITVLLVPYCWYKQATLVKPPVLAATSTFCDHFADILSGVIKRGNGQSLETEVKITGFKSSKNADVPLLQCGAPQL